MRPPASSSPLPPLIATAATQVARRPYLSLSVLAHAALLGLLYAFGTYESSLRQREVDEAEVASSLRATHAASSAKRLQDLQTIKELLEQSAGRADAELKPSNPADAAPPAPQTPEEMVEQARELSKEIDRIDEAIQAGELADLTGARPPTPVAEPPPAAKTPPAGGDPAPQGKQASAHAAVTPEAAASEIAAIEAKARATLARRKERLESRKNGVPVEGNQAGAREGAGGSPGASNPTGRGPDESVRAQIDDFIGAGDGVEQAEPSRRYFGNDFFDHGRVSIPAVDATGLVLGQGRMLGQGGEFANRVYLDTWYIIGPFPGRHEAGLFDNPSYPPEKAVLLDAAYYGKDQRVLRWRYVTARSYPLMPPDQAEDSVYYGYTEVHLDQARDLTAWIGADDDVQVYLNDRLVWKGGNVNKQSYFDAIFNAPSTYLRDYNRTEGRRVLHFDKGRNRLFFKLSNGPNGAFFSMVLTP